MTTKRTRIKPRAAKEPQLPVGVGYAKYSDAYISLISDDYSEEDQCVAFRGIWSPSDLRMIADHMEYMQAKERT